METKLQQQELIRLLTMTTFLLLCLTQPTLQTQGKDKEQNLINSTNQTKNNTRIVIVQKKILKQEIFDMKTCDEPYDDLELIENKRYEIQNYRDRSEGFKRRPRMRDEQDDEQHEWDRYQMYLSHKTDDRRHRLDMDYQNHHAKAHEHRSRRYDPERLRRRREMAARQGLDFNHMERRFDDEYDDEEDQNQQDEQKQQEEIIEYVVEEVPYDDDELQEYAFYPEKLQELIKNQTNDTEEQKSNNNQENDDKNSQDEEDLDKMKIDEQNNVISEKDQKKENDTSIENKTTLVHINMFEQKELVENKFNYIRWGDEHQIYSFWIQQISEKAPYGMIADEWLIKEASYVGINITSFKVNLINEKVYTGHIQYSQIRNETGQFITDKFRVYVAARPKD